MKVSIITINFNNAVGLEKTINSIINQNFKDFEYIIIDGNSNDNSVGVIETYSDQISYWISESDKGIYNAMNKGIKQACGEYILFINSGDTLYDNAVLKNVFSYSYNDDLIYGDLERVYPDGKTMIEYAPDNANIYFIMKCSLHHPSTFIKRNLFLKYGLYREDLKIVSDWAFFVHLAAFTTSTRIHIPVIIASFNMDGISSNVDMVEKEKQIVIKQTFSPELLKIIEFNQTFYAYDKFYNKKLFVVMRKILDFFRRNK